MGRKLDRIMYEISVLYIALPVYIFLSGWLRPVVAIPACVIFLVSVYLMLMNRPSEISWSLTRKDLRVIIIVIAVLALWVFFSGIGGLSFQNSDYNDRNAIFRDLIEKSWPVTYHFNVGTGVAVAQGLNTFPEYGILTYYIAFWLPSALFGKLFGWYAANVFLYFWTLLGVILITYFIFRTLQRASVRSVLILIFFSGMDILGYLGLNKGVWPQLISHIEWWSGNYQYSSNTTALFWVFNQTVAFWLAILLILNMKNSRSLFFLYAMLLLNGPFPFLGMLPFVLWKAYQGYPLFAKTEIKRNILLRFILWGWSGVRRAITFENVAGGLTVLIISYLYYASNVSAGRYMGVNHFVGIYFVFILFEVGCYLFFLFAVNYNKPVYWICIGSVILIPLFQVGIGQDFCMRVSIPALFVIHIMLQQALLGRKHVEIRNGTDEQVQPEKHDNPVNSIDEIVLASHQVFKITPRDRNLLMIILAFMLLIGSVVPIMEISRSLWYTLPEYAPTRQIMIFAGEALKDSGNSKVASVGESWIVESRNGRIWWDYKQTLQNPDITTTNFVGTTEGNFFYNYLARQP